MPDLKASGLDSIPEENQQTQGESDVKYEHYVNNQN